MKYNAQEVVTQKWLIQQRQLWGYLPNRHFLGAQ